MHLEITFYNLKVIKHNTNVKYKHVRIQKGFQGEDRGIIVFWSRILFSKYSVEFISVENLPASIVCYFFIYTMKNCLTVSSWSNLNEEIEVESPAWKNYFDPPLVSVMTWIPLRLCILRSYSHIIQLHELRYIEH